MARVEIEEIVFPADTAKFVRTWWRVYEGDPHWVPPLLYERKRFFDPEINPYFNVAKVQCFRALRDGEPVGTIGVTVDRNYQREDPGAGFFGFFEFIDDDQVSQALFEAGCGWLRTAGMTRVLGPFNFNSNHEFGLLVDGFDSDPVVANPHNRKWFVDHYERLGLAKAMDWYAYWLDSKEVDPRIVRIATRTLSRHPEITVRNLDLKNFDREVEVLHSIYEDAWEHNWGHVQMEREEFDYLAQGFRSVLDPNLCFIVEIAGEPVGMSITLPDINQAVKKMNGRLFPVGWFHFLTRERSINRLRVFMLGIKQKFQHLPLGALLYAKTWEHGIARGVVGAEASLILDNNDKMRGPLEKMGGRIYKTYRSYEMTL